MSASRTHECQAIKDLERLVAKLVEAVEYQSVRITELEGLHASNTCGSSPCIDAQDDDRYPPHWLHIKVNSTATDADVSVTRHPPDGVEIKIGRATDIIEKLSRHLHL